MLLKEEQLGSGGETSGSVKILRRRSSQERMMIQMGNENISSRKISTVPNNAIRSRKV